MIPIALDPRQVALAVVGRGEPVRRRYAALLAGGATEGTLFSDRPDPETAALAGPRLRPWLPAEAELGAFQAVWIAGLPEAMAADLAAATRRALALVNVEDVKPLSDFHNVAEVRRGDLLLTVSTGGRSPGLAARLRGDLERRFDADWAERLDHIGARREAWRAEGRSMAEVARLTDVAVAEAGWLA